MCKRYVISRTMLGAREQGWTLDDGVSISEMTSKEIMNALDAKQEIYGLAVENNKLVPDRKFFTRNIMEHRQVNNYRPMYEADASMSNIFYIVTGKNENGYSVISTKHERTVISEDKCRLMLEMGIISAGAKLENGEIILPDFDSTPKENESLKGSITPKENTTPNEDKNTNKKNDKEVKTSTTKIGGKTVTISTKK